MNALAIEPLEAPPDTTVEVPGSKSITNRAVLLAALAEGTSELDDVLMADDTEAMIEAVRDLGADVVVDGDRAIVTGTGGRLRPGPMTLHAREAGTVARFLPPVVAAGEGPYVIDGGPGMRERPMGVLVEGLRQLGVTVDEERRGRLPLTVTGPPVGDHVRLRGDVSSQFLSGLLLAGPLYPNGLDVELTTELVSRPYVDMTRALMASFGAPGRYHGADLTIEPDATAASYFFAAAAITGGRVRVEGLGRRSLQGDLRFVDVLAQMGAKIDVGDDGTVVQGTGTLHGLDVDLRDLSDTAQTLAAVAVFADSPTRVTGIGFVRGKETDRIAAVVRELQRCGIDAEAEPDGFVVHPGAPRPTVVETYGDHRMAMSFALLGLRVPGIGIADPGCVAKTFPGFWDVLDGLRH